MRTRAPVPVWVPLCTATPAVRELIRSSTLRIGRLGGDFRGIDLRDRVAELDAALLTSRRRDNGCETDGNSTDREIDCRFLVVGDADRLLLLAISDAKDADLVRPGRDAADQ